MTTLSDVLAYVTSTATADECEAIFDTCRDRVKALHDINARANAASLNVGDKVRLIGISPKYLNGCKAVIDAKRNGRFVVKLDAEHEFSRAWTRSVNGMLEVHASCVEAR